MMNKEDLLKKLEELNTAPVFRKTQYDEYRQILNDLEQMGVPPLSHTLQNDKYRDLLLTRFLEDQISLKLRNALIRNGIKTIGDLLDLNRLDTINYSGFGDRKWGELYRLQKMIYDSLPHKESNSDVNNTLPLYDVKELNNIHQEMLALEVTYAKGERWDRNKYQELLIGLNKRGQKRSDIFKDEEIDDVSIDVLDLNPRLKKLIERLNYGRMVQIIDITENAVLNVPQQGKKSWTEIIELKKEITDSQTYYLEKYKKYYMIRELPENTEVLPLYKKILLAMRQLTEILETRGLKRNSYIINEYFINGTSVEDIRNNLANMHDSLDKERVRQITVEIQEKLMSGSYNPLIDNAYFSDDFVNELNVLSQEILYCPVSYANKVLQAPDDFDATPILRLLNLDILEITNDRNWFMDAPRIISSDDYRENITRHIKAVDFVMSLFAMPATKDEIISEVMSSQYLTGKSNLNVIEKILCHHSWIEFQNGQYVYRYDKLKTAEAKAARIVYEKKNVTTSEIKEIDAKRMHLNPEQGLRITAARVISKYSWVARGAKNTELIYRPLPMSTIPSLREATESYANIHILFKFDEMVSYLKRHGYDRYADSSFRSYVLKCCVPSNKDSNLLCLESEIENHNPDTWRSRTIQGTTNWVINSCITLLGNKKLKKSELNKIVMSQPEAENYNIQNIYSLYLSNYCCNYDDINPNKLFITKDELIWVNKQCLDEGLVDLETVGSVNRQPDYYMDVMTEIVNQLKQAKDQRMKLAHLKQACFPLITVPSKETTFYKLIKRLPDEVVRTEVDGAICLELKKDKLAYEKSYSLPAIDQESSSKDDLHVSDLQIIETDKPEKVYIRGKIDWNDMASELKRELDYYNRWWDVRDVTLDEGIDFFVNFLKDSQDTALHEDVSRHIYEFLTQKLDRYDLHDHMRSIVLGAEPIIRGIYMHNNSCTTCPRGKGLTDSLTLVPDLKRWVDDIFAYQKMQNYYDFRKTYLGFYSVRNKFAHGVSIEMNTGNKYLSTYGYLALYVYIYCRFVKN